MELSELNQWINKTYHPGESREETFLVGEDHTAYHIGSGDSRVLSTPSMISFMEQVAHRLLEERLPEDLLSVGIAVDIRHLAAAPLHAQIRVRAELLEIDHNRLCFKVSAEDEWETLGAGKHHRAVIDRKRFQNLINRKQES